MRCSCGAILPEDARFCHKCGQPQFAEDIERLNAPPEPAILAAEAPPLPAPGPVGSIGFTNGRAVRITLAVAAFSLLAFFIAALIAPPLVIPLFVVAGFSAVRIYLNGSQESLRPSGAALLGAMPWFWFFLLQSIGIAVLLFSPEGHAMAKAMNNPDVMQFINDPAKQVFALVFSFFIGTAAGAVGGILAVRWQPRNGPLH